MADDNIITQLSIFVNNEPGRLAAIAGILKECSINLKAFNLAESTEFGILRAIVDDPERAYDLLKAKGIIVRKTDIIGMMIEDAPGSLLQASQTLGDAGINIEYGYAYDGRNGAILFIRVDDSEKAVSALGAEGVRLVTREEI